ncbi:MAG TPA: hypothetical protein VK762_02060 [Polyangiaceae bacterium]|jgi:hypothetical protein|nr:hypothetical protein [Polyangiaceae bacterium]
MVAVFMHGRFATDEPTLDRHDLQSFDDEGRDVVQNPNDGTLSVVRESNHLRDSITARDAPERSSAEPPSREPLYFPQ